MSLYDDASLALLTGAGAGKDGKLYVAKPTDGTGDFEFVRGSNLSATRVGPTGLIEKGRENLLLQSNQFDTTWTTLNASVTSGQSGYDGSSDAWLLETTDTASILYQNVSSSGVQTVSVYAKAGTTDNLVFYALTSPSVRAGFDLTTGTVNYELRNIDASIEDVGNGWYRCSMVFSGASTSIRIYPTDSTLTAAIGDNIYIQDAQLEVGLAATDYIESGASTGKAGLLENEPRFDYSGSATCPSLLVESSRTNLIAYSEYLQGNSEFKILGSSVTFADYTETSPEGNANALRILEAEGTGNHNWYYDNLGTFVNGTTYAFSFFAKSIGGRNIRFDEGGLGVDMQGIIDLSDGSILQDTHSNISVESYGNGWYRISVVGTMNGTTQRIIFNTTDGTNTSFAGDTTSGVSLWGIQLEEGSYPTSYIPNHSGGSVTRLAEKQEVTGLTSSVLNQSKGSFYIELQTLSTDAGRVVITSYPTGASNDTMRFIFTNQISFGLVSTGTLTDSTNTTSAKTKIIGTYSGTELKLCVNGGAVQKLSGNFSFANQPTKIFTHAFVDTIRLFAEIDQMLYFPEALTDVECIKLTEL